MNEESIKLFLKLDKYFGTDVDTPDPQDKLDFLKSIDPSLEFREVWVNVHNLINPAASFIDFTFSDVEYNSPKYWSDRILWFDFNRETDCKNSKLRMHIIKEFPDSLFILSGGNLYLKPKSEVELA